MPFGKKNAAPVRISPTETAFLQQRLKRDSKNNFRAAMLIDPVELTAVINQLTQDLLMRMTVMVLISGIYNVRRILLDQLRVKVV